ncbi:putative glutamate-1-semialdehyde 2,1-aminomutase [Tricladium varicosporioides]|nr:putative glutamate-1-semialdehyde 2,1-aminomutase [Hymenoscyphus varicosporioides]
MSRYFSLLRNGAELQNTPPSSSPSSIKSLRSPASPFDPLGGALSSAQARYTVSNSQSLEAHNEACHDFPGGNTRTVLHSSPFPITFVGAKGCELTSLDGDVYIDFLGEYTAGIFGHSNGEISSSITEALSKGWNYGGSNPYERELARKVKKRFSPSGIELVRFTNSGTEANTMAIAAACAFTGRKKIVVFSNGYHGGTLYFPHNLSHVNVNLPHEFVICPYNDIEGTKKLIASLPKNSLAAIMVELIQGSGGCIIGTNEFLHYLNKAAHALGALFLVDEVMTSRLAYHGLSHSLGLKPDLVSLGKWIGGGMSFGAFGGRKDRGVMSMFDPRNGVLSHSGTFNNNIVTMAAGCAGMDIYNENQVRTLNSLGEKLKTGVEHILLKYGISPQQNGISKKKGVSDTEKLELESPFTGLSISSEKETEKKAKMWISGQGSMLCVHFSGESEKSLKGLFWHHMLENGIYVAPRGFMGLNLELEEIHIEQYIEAVEKFVGRHKGALIS